MIFTKFCLIPKLMKQMDQYIKKLSRKSLHQVCNCSGQGSKTILIMSRKQKEILPCLEVNFRKWSNFSLEILLSFGQHLYYDIFNFQRPFRRFQRYKFGPLARLQGATRDQACLQKSFTTRLVQPTTAITASCLSLNKDNLMVQTSNKPRLKAPDARHGKCPRKKS